MSSVALLNAYAEKHGLKPVSYGMEPGEFIEQAFKIMLTEFGPLPTPNPAQVLTPVHIK